MIAITNAFLFLGLAVLCMPILARANGTRPFVMGYLGISVVLMFNSGAEVIGETPLDRYLSRFLIGAVIIGTLAWAAKNRGH